NVANLGRKPYRSLSADVIGILQDDLRLLLRGEVIWEKASTSSGSCAWGSFAKASNPVLRDMTERVVIASKGRFARALTLQQRRRRDLPHESTLTNDEFVDVTRDVWRIDAESATRIGHPAPFPVELPRRLIDLYTFRGDIVLDPFAGSGTTLIAAARTGRIGVGYDTDPAYVELAQQRLDAERERAARRDDTIDRIEQADTPDQQVALLGQLGADDRHEHFQASAVHEGKKSLDIAKLRLLEAGFDVDDKARHPSRLIEFDLLVTSPDGLGRWWVEVSGGFTTSRPGLQRTDAVWKLLGRLHVLRATGERDRRRDDRVLVLTAELPKRNSPGDRALHAVGPGVIFDAIELYDPAGIARLRHYATATDPTPRPGFWSEAELEGPPAGR
ncbi:MAG: DNA-methyltransferase, partial [Desertimonas sp.]